jgi:hypothetical protein
MAADTMAMMPLPRADTMLSVAESDLASDVGSLSTVGPSPSARFYMEEAARAGVAHGCGGTSRGGETVELAPHTKVSAAEIAELDESVRRGEIGDGHGGGGDSDDDDMSVLTVTRTVTRMEDLPEDKSEAIGTVLEEVKPKPVPLVVEFLGSNRMSNEATRAFCNELFDAPLELSIECQFLPKVDLFSNSDPYAELYARAPHKTTWGLVGRTETIANAHFPRFVAKFTLDVQPDADMERELLVKVLARGNFSKPTRLGEATCRVWDVVSAPGQCKVMRLAWSADPKKESWVILSGDICRDRMHALAPRAVTLHVRLGESARPRSKTHYVVSRALKKGRWTPVYRSEGHAHADREYAPAALRFADVFAGDEAKPTRVEFYQRRVGVDPKMAGFVQFSVRQVERMEEGRAFQWWAGQDAVAPGDVMLVKKVVERDEIKLWIAVTN